MRFIEIEEERTWCFKYITMMCRVFGLAVVAFLCFMVADILAEEKYHTVNGWYLLGVTIVVSFLEFVWLLDKCNCCDDRSCCCQMWSAVKWIDCWRKTLLYCCLPIPLFLRNVDSTSNVLKAILSGVAVTALGVAYFVKSFKNSSCAKISGTHRSYLELRDQAASQMTTPQLLPHSAATIPAQQQAPNESGFTYYGTANQDKPELANQDKPELANQDKSELANQDKPELANQDKPELANQEKATDK